VKLYDRMFPSKNSRIENEEPEEQDVSEVFDIEASISSFQQKQQNSDLISTVDKDLKYFELETVPKACNCFMMHCCQSNLHQLLTIKFFSVAGNFKNKIRNRTFEKIPNCLAEFFFSRENDK
jgi:hypothetical protein